MHSPAFGDATRLTERLFRHEAGKLVSVLTKMFGTERLQLAEDVVQEALVRAMQIWPYYGIPDNPAAWITQTAKNLAVDVIRREKRLRDKEPGIAGFIEQQSAPISAANSLFFDDEIKEDRLRMMFACCHPLVPEDARVALALKTLCGFSAAEIASAFLMSEAAVAKRLTRARQKIRELRVPFEIPSGQELAVRLDSVEQALYLLFNEGYKASNGENLIRAKLCHEAIGLGSLLVSHPVGDAPRTHALLALMYLNAARLPGRVDSEGNLLRLEEQDRSSWERPMIALGMLYLGRSAAGAEIGEYHLQAGIAACHCAAPNFESTDWTQILSLYDEWMTLDDSPVVALNRAVAVANVRGPRVGIDAVNRIPNRDRLDRYYLLYAVLGEFETQLDNFGPAAAHYRKALQFTAMTSEHQFLAKRLKQCETRAAAGSKGRSLPGSG